MSREWLALYGAMATKPRYRRLTPLGRGALLHTFLLAGFQSPEATWDDREELREALTLEGFPAASLDELVGLGWLVEDDGALVIRDWDKHQRAASKEAQATWEAARKRQWRRRKRLGAESPPAPPSREDEREREREREGSRTRDGHVRDRAAHPSRLL